MPSTAPASLRVDRVVRFAAKAAVAVFGVFFALLLGIRVVVYPQLEVHRADIARWLGAAIGQPVEIDDIVTGWDGWNPRLSIRGFRVRETAGNATLVDLPRVDLLVAWTSLPRLDLRLKELSIDSPRLSVRRDAQGRLHLAGFEMAAESHAGDSAFAAWLLRQPQVIVRDALVAWNDELRNAPQMLLDHVQLRLEQRFGRHRAGLTGVPPPELAGPIDVRADFTGVSRDDLSHLRGRLYFRLDYADVAAWREWLPLPFAIESGRGALRVWADVADGQANGVVADLELADVRATLGHHLPPLGLAHLSGRAEWKHSTERTLFKASRLLLALPDGSTLRPTHLDVALDEPAAGPPGRGSVAVSEVDLGSLAAIAADLPLPDAVRRDIARFAPHGTVRNARIEWTGEPGAPQRYALKADVGELAVASQDGLPGVANLSGTIDMNERGGELRVAGGRATLALPKVFAGPLALDSVAGSVRWQRTEGRLQVQWNDVAFANEDLAGTAAGKWESHAEGPGSVDVAAQLTRAKLASAHRYVPVFAPPALRDWLRRALVKGHSSDVRLALAGDLGHFPFGRGNDGRFELDVTTRDATLAYAERWPVLTDVAAELRINGPHVVVDATGARLKSAQVTATRAEIADFRDANPLLRIDGKARGPSAQFLAFVAASPVGEWIAHATDGITATGDGELSLKFALPLHDPAATTIDGHYRFASAAVQMPRMPLISDASGDLAFSEHGVRASGITGQALGGSVKLALAADGRHVKVDGSGAADVAQVRDAFGDAPLLGHVTGNTDWRLALDANNGQVAWTVDSSLAGVRIDLPAPLGKAAGETLPVHVVRRATGVQEDRIDVDYGDVARLLLHRQASGRTLAIDRALVLVGKALDGTSAPDQAGVWIRADVGTIDVDAWLDIDRAQGSGSMASAATNGLALNGIELRAANVTALGRKFSAVRTTARRRSSDWRLALDGDELSGTATWRAATSAEPNGRFSARLTRFRMPPAHVAVDAIATTAVAAQAHHWPAVDLVADIVEKKGRALGRLELLAQPSGTDWQIQKLALVNDAGRIDAQGSWRNVPHRSQTRLDIAIEVREAGAFLGRFGWPDAIRGAPTKIDGDVSWDGAPSDFDYPSLTGRLTLHAGAGQFTKLEPGVGRLLGVLSLQALPRRISLDFRDVFSEGFAFDTIAGDIRMDRGVMHTENLRLSGPAAAVDIAGDVDLAHETQQLSVRVQPSLSTGVSAGAAALFIANPLLGAAIGAGTLLAQKMLNNPFDQLFSYRYAVTGSFDDPVVTRPGARAASPSPASVTIR